MMSLRRGLMYALCAGMVGAIALGGNASAQAGGVTVMLASQNNSGIAGTATLTDIGGGRTRVEIRVSGAGAGPEPAHIHEGSCAQLNPTPQFPLTNVANGTSTTEIASTIAQVTSSPHAIHLHKSPDELTVYVACANLVAPGTLPSSGEAETNAAGLAWGVAGLVILAAGLGLRRRARLNG